MSYFDNHFLFSETYIKEQSKKKTVDDDDVESVFIQIKQWNMEYVSGDPWSDYIDEVLDALGFQKTPKNSYRLLYADSINEGEKPVAICNLLDKNEDVATTTKGKYYAVNTIKAAKANGVTWAMLTNGYKWRIYNINNVSPYENYLEIDIEESIRNNTKSDEAFRLFYLFFNVYTYYTENGQLHIDNIKDLSDKKAEIIEETLRGKAEEILKELCYGLKEDMPKETYTEDEKKSIYNDAIILLYRLLFFGYAESRGLLPVMKNDPEYTDSYKKLCDDAVEIYNSGEIYKIKDDYGFWDRLDNQLRLYVNRSYNGGLFNNEDKCILKEHKIANGRLTKCLSELSYNSDKSGKYSEVIEYKDLSVRNLGSIYEGLLEYRLFIAEERMVQRKNKGQVKYLKESEVKLQNSDLKNIIEKGGIYLSQDALERKETGAYYTPEDVVEYIIENTVGKKLIELKEDLSETKKILLEKLSYEPVESNRRALQMQIDEITLNFINEKLLSLSIIDSAMGSGHFLVNATYRVANEIVNIIAENNWESDEEYNNVDIKYWKRKVVENCIYGIDINGLSVSLAKLSLWLISASNDRALSFLDHHLKKGNSIIGTDRSHVEIKDIKYPLFGVSYEQYMKPILKKYRQLNEIGSATKAKVTRQKEIYDEIKNCLKITKKKYDYYLSKQYLGEPINEDAYGNLLRSNEIDDFGKQKMEKLWKISKDKKFFHWELEFPEVFQKNGFDIVIGNPPYVDVKENDYKTVKETLTCKNLYAYMAEININNLKPNGKYGVIIPSSSVCTPRMSKFQKFLLNSSSEIYIATFDDRPGKIFSNLESMRVAIIYMTKRVREDIKTKLYVTKYNRFYTFERNKLFNDLKFTELSKYNYGEGYIPKIGNIIEIKILKKLFKKKDNLFGLIKPKGNPIYYGVGVRYWIKVLSKPSIDLTDSNQRRSSGEKVIYIDDKIKKGVIVSILNSSLFFWFYQQFSDCRNFSMHAVNLFPFDVTDLSKDIQKSLDNLSSELMIDYFKNSIIKETTYKSTGYLRYREFKIKLSKNIIDKIDLLLGIYYKLTEEEINFIKNYDIRYRIGENPAKEDE